MRASENCTHVRAVMSRLKDYLEARFTLRFWFNIYLSSILLRLVQINNILIL
jgi:hypothetical protein